MSNGFQVLLSTTTVWIIYTDFSICVNNLKNIFGSKYFTD